MEIDHNKYFSNALKTIIAPSLKKHGFTKRGTLTFIRRTEFDIIQTINFQKSKWGDKGFYVNSCSLSLHNKREHFIGDIGHRLHAFNGSINASFNFQIPIIGDICLKEIKVTILNRVLPYLDFTKSLEDIHQLAIFSTENLDNSPFLKSFAYKYPNEGSEIAFRYLCLQDYDRALDIYDGIEERKFNPETKEWTYFKSKRYDDIISQLVNKEYGKIKETIAKNIQMSLIKTKFEKLKPVSIQSMPLEELISVLKPSEKSKIPRS